MGFFFKFLLTTIVWGLVGAIGGFVVGFAITQGLFVSWAPMSLPEGAVLDQFLPQSEPGASLESLLATSTAGDLYYYDMSIDQASEQWRPIDDNSEEATFFGSCTTDPRHDGLWVRRPPGEISAQLDCQTMWTEVVLYYRFVVLENGEVWLWRHSGGINNFFTLFFAVTMPCIALGFIGSLVFAVNQFRRISQEVPPPEPD